MPRSGTTLLVELLAGHPDVAASAETHFFRTTCRSARAAGRKLSANQATRVYANLHDALRGRCLTLEDTTPVPSFESGARLADVAKVAFDDFAADAKSKLVIEKTPDHGFHIEAITTVFPDARFVFIVRDPRDVALSWMKAPWNPAGLVWPAIKWHMLLREMTRQMNREPKRFLLLRYEDLVADPSKEVRRLADFLHLDARAFAPQPDRASTFDPGAEPWKARAITPIDGTSVGRWRSEMTAADQVIFDRLLGNRMAAFDYPRSELHLRDAGLFRVAAKLVREIYLLLRRVPRAIARTCGLLR